MNKPRQGIETSSAPTPTPRQYYPTADTGEKYTEPWVLGRKTRFDVSVFWAQEERVTAQLNEFCAPCKLKNWFPLTPLQAVRGIKIPEPRRTLIASNWISRPAHRFRKLQMLERVVEPETEQNSETRSSYRSQLNFCRRSNPLVTKATTAGYDRRQDRSRTRPAAVTLAFVACKVTTTASSWNRWRDNQQTEPSESSSTRKRSPSVLGRQIWRHFTQK